ncbi:orcokinin peptides type A-like isoform X2 [Pseudomyrmex gracilis]|uniref:orcokinin peptides type A-like isoform X2 n=1 Tax=Pseudomyrmex gracilis TaxID=219809 RepID=UPI000995A3E7|nr:orcokinin peptides type A-like isoform X2 [Pseudomyrmex gracilis]
MAFSGSSIAIVFIAAYAAAGPVQLHDGSNTLQRDEYGPLVNFGARYWNDRGSSNRNLDGGHLSRQLPHRGLDLNALSGVSFGNKRFASFRRPGTINLRPGNFDEIDRSVFDRLSKRNFDEIDRSVFDRFSKKNIDEIDNAFDSFFKRNFDEIDRGNWNGFVKRLDNYLADEQQR